MVFDDVDFGFLLIVGRVAIFFGGCVWSMLNSRQTGHDRDR